MHEQICAGLPQTISQTAGVFLFLVSEAILGKTKFGSWLGLARAAIWFIVSLVFGGLARMGLAALRFKSGQKSPENGEQKNG